MKHLPLIHVPYNVNIQLKWLLAALSLLFSMGELCAQKNDSIDRSNYQLLWEVTGNGLDAPQYLFGTYHSNDPDIFNFPDELFDAIYQADAIILETDITELMDDDRYFDHSSFNFGNDIFDWIVPFSNRDRVTFTGYGSDNGRPQFIDLYFKQIADNCDKKFYPLESIEDQMSIGWNNEVDTTVEGYIETPSKEEMKQLYLEGQASKLHDYTKLSTRRYVNLYEELLIDRNLVMANGLDTLMQDQNVFCAVGAAHLMGPKGIVPILEEKGYTVQPVDPTFTEEKSSSEKELDKCSGYLYFDPKFGARIEFTGKPVISEQENGGRLVQYREMGQGNTYTLNMQHYEVITDLDEVVKNYFTTEPEHISQYDSLMIDGEVVARQARIDRGGNNVYWMRAFHRNDVLYTLYCTGGYRFVNSDRPFKFFETFSFEQSNDENIHFDTVLSSPSGLLAVDMPAETEVFHEETGTDKYWYAKWFDPANGTSLYIYENQVTDNSLYLNDKGFGNYLLEEFHTDSIQYYGFVENENFSEKSFSTHRLGREVYGRMRLIGNIIQYAQYTGHDSLQAAKFLNNFSFKEPEDSVPDQQKITNASLSSYLTKSGFSPKKYDEKYLYRTTKHYLTNDAENVITYQAYKKDFKPWAFSNKSVNQLLSDQVIWPKKEVEVEIDSSFSIVNGNPTLLYSIHYTSSKNMLKGRVLLQGKTIGTCNMIYPYAFDEYYKALDFTDSIRFHLTNDETIDAFDLTLIKEALINDGSKGIAQLVENDHVNQENMQKILGMEDSLFLQHDQKGFLQYTLLFKLAEFEKNAIDPVQLWNARATRKNPLLTEALLYFCAHQGDETAFNTIAAGAHRKNIPWENKEQLLNELKSTPDFLSMIWNSFEPSILDSLSWKMSFHLAELSSDPFFERTFKTETFASSMLSANQPEWAAFRYFEWIYKSEIPNKKAFLDSLIHTWHVDSDEDFRMGVKIGWEHVLHGKISRKLKKKVEQNITRSIAYSKVMAISGTPEYDLFSFEEILGMISFDHYEDSFYDPNKTIEVLDQFELVDRDFVLYKCIENKKVYYLAQELPENKTLPTYKGFGEGAYFFFFSQEPGKDELKKALLERLSE